MLEIGKNKSVVIRAKGKPVMENGKPATKLVSAKVIRATRDEYGHNSKYQRKLVVSLEAVDIVRIRPMGLRTCEYTATVYDIYRWMARSAANNELLKKAREKKAKKQERLARERQASFERRFSKRVREENATARGSG